MRSVKLHDPIPESPSFRWLSISDDQLYTKNYQVWEGIYPEVRSARYRTLVEDIKETMLTVRCDQGALSLAGAIPARLFREWCLNSLGEVIRVHHKFQAEVAEFVPTMKLASTGEMARFNVSQKECVLDLIIALLAVKSGAGADLWPLSGSPLDLAATLGSYVTVQVPVQCHEKDCEDNEEMLVACENCGETNFTLQRADDTWELICRKPRTKRWVGRLPLKQNCMNGHTIELSEEMLVDVINVVPGPDLLVAIADVINSYLKGYNFDTAQETFFIRGRNLWYFPDRGKAWARILVIQNIGTVEAGGTVIGIKNKRGKQKK